MRLRFGSRGNARTTAQTEHGELFVVRGLPLHRNVPSGSELTAPNKDLKEHLPSLFADAGFPYSTSSSLVCQSPK